MRVEERVTDILHELNQPLSAIANYAQASIDRAYRRTTRDSAPGIGTEAGGME